MMMIQADSSNELIGILMITPRLAEEIDELCLVVIICQELLSIRRFLCACPLYNELLTTAPSLTFHRFNRIGSIHICAEHVDIIPKILLQIKLKLAGISLR